MPRTQAPILALALAAALDGCGARSELRVRPRDAAVDDVRDSGTRIRATVLAAGARHACASLTDGTTRCWGANESGQLGDGTTRDAARPVFALLPDGAARLAAGDHHSCGQGPGGGVFCWGGNESGQLGDGTLEARSEPVRVLVAGVSEMSLGRAHTLFRLDDRTARAFGANELCQLGNSLRGALDPQPAPIEHFTDLTAIGAGGNFTCGVQQGGVLGCVGTLRPTSPTWCFANNEGGPAVVNAVAVGNRHVCVRSDTGLVFCRGDNESGQLGDGTHSGRDQWRPSSGDLHANVIAAGATHTCALLVDSHIVCWGSNAHGELALTGSPDHASPLDVSIGGPATALALGDGFSCALRNDGAVMCWGANDRGQLGDGTTVSRAMPMPVAF